MSIIGEIKKKKYRPEWISTYEDFYCKCKKFECARKKNKNEKKKKKNFISTGWEGVCCVLV